MIYKASQALVISFCFTGVAAGVAKSTDASFFEISFLAHTLVFEKYGREFTCITLVIVRAETCLAFRVTGSAVRDFICIVGGGTLGNADIVERESSKGWAAEYAFT